MDTETTPPTPVRTYTPGTWQYHAQAAIAELQEALEMESAWGQYSDRTKRPLVHARQSVSSAVREMGKSRRLHREFLRRRKREEAMSRQAAYDRDDQARKELARRGVEVPIDRTGYFSPSLILERVLREERKNTGTEG